MSNPTDMLSSLLQGLATRLSYLDPILQEMRGWALSCKTKDQGQVTCSHCKKYLVKMTTSAWLLQFQGSLNRFVVGLKKFRNTIIIHQLPHNTNKLQRASTDTCQ